MTVGLLPASWGGPEAAAAARAVSGQSSDAGEAADTEEAVVADTEEEAFARAARLGRNVEILALRGESTDPADQHHALLPAVHRRQ